MIPVMLVSDTVPEFGFDIIPLDTILFSLLDTLPLYHLTLF